MNLTNVEAPRKTDKEIGELFKRSDSDKNGTLSKSVLHSMPTSFCLPT